MNNLRIFGNSYHNKIIPYVYYLLNHMYVYGYYDFETQLK